MTVDIAQTAIYFLPEGEQPAVRFKAMTRQQSMTTTLPRYQWSANEYQGMIEAGVFDAIRFRLLHGDVVISGAVCKPYRWTLEDYEQLVALGLLEGKHVELVQGEILVMSPMGEPHALTIMQLNEILLPHFNSRTGYRLRIQMPLALPFLASALEPDLAVVALNAPASAAGCPTSAALVIEVAESSLDYDRDHKAPLYAAAGIRDFWLVNLPDRCLDVYRHPVPDPQSFSAWRYRDCRVLQAGEQISPLAAPEIAVPVAAVFLA